MLFTFAGGMGHFLPLVALARVAERAGHVVAFGAQPGMLPSIEEAGFGAYDTGGETLLLANERTPLLELDAAREARTIRDGYAGTIARERARSVHRLCEAWDPDVIVCDEVDFGALIAAEVLGIPYATVVCIGSGSWVWPSLVREPLADLRSAHGLPADPELLMLRRHLILSPFPPSFRDPRNPLPENAHALRLVPTHGETTADASWLAARAPRPLVYFTLGTIFNLESGDLFERVLEGLSELPLDVVVTVGRELDPAVLGRQPPNVRVRRYVPQSALLPHGDLCVSHGGSGSVLGALTYGIPMVLLPIGADQPLNAVRCKELEVAEVLDAASATPQDVKRAAAAVLADPAYARNAKQLEAKIAALPGPEHGLRLIEQIADRRP
jgi:UDP:flavonoid glycosyltransferase YjiC (YdhE family)